MRVVNYSSIQKLNCGPCGGEVVICVDPTLTLTGAPFIEATILTVQERLGSLNSRLWNYNFQYDQTQLLDPNRVFTGCDIRGVFCRGCLSDYLDWIVQQGAQTPITPINSQTIELNVSGPNNHTIEGDVVISGAAGNLLSVNPDGLFAGGFVNSDECPSLYFVGTSP